MKNQVKTEKRGCAHREEVGHAVEICNDQIGMKKLMGRATLAKEVIVYMLHLSQASENLQ